MKYKNRRSLTPQITFYCFKWSTCYITGRGILEKCSKTPLKVLEMKYKNRGLGFDDSVCILLF